MDAARPPADMQLYEALRALLIVVWSTSANIIATLWWCITPLWWYIVLPTLVFLIVLRFAESITRFLTWTWRRMSAIRTPMMLRQRLTNFATWVRQMAIALRFNKITDGTHSHYQQVIFFVRHQKALIFGFLLLSWVVSAHAERESSANAETFVRLQDIQRYCPHCRLPDFVAKPKLEFGSNSHYLREPEPAIEDDRWYEAISPNQISEINDRQPQSKSSKKATISSDRTTMKASQTETASFTRPRKSEKVRRSVGLPRVWCRECEQWHCCELPY